MLLIKNKKRIFKYLAILFCLVCICFLLFINLWRLETYVSYIKYKNEYRFVKLFLSDLKNSTIDKLNKYFLTPRAQNLFGSLETYDKKLRKRNYIIERIHYDRDLDLFLIGLSTSKNMKRYRWLFVYVAKRDNKYYIAHFNIRNDFPSPDNY